MGQVGAKCRPAKQVSPSRPTEAQFFPLEKWWSSYTAWLVAGWLESMLGCLLIVPSKDGINDDESIELHLTPLCNGQDLEGL